MTHSALEFSNALVALLPRMRRFALALTGATSDADDLVQDAIERALRKRELWRAGTRLDSWVFRIMQNAWIDTTRARRVRAAASLEDEGMEAPGIDGRTAMEAHLTLARAKTALAALPADGRAVVALILIEGYSYREAAEILGVPEGTVTSRLFRARTALDAAIAAPSAAAAAAPQRDAS
jgi:RNA polymerase sigma-70 factor (ECF subfamily)